MHKKARVQNKQHTELQDLYTLQNLKSSSLGATRKGCSFVTRRSSTYKADESYRTLVSQHTL